MPLNSPIAKKKKKANLEESNETSNHDVQQQDNYPEATCSANDHVDMEVDQSNSPSSKSPHHIDSNEPEHICQACKREKMKLRRSVEYLQSDVKRWKRKFAKQVDKSFSFKALKSDKKIKHFPGIPSKAAFNALFRMIKGKVPKLKY